MGQFDATDQIWNPENSKLSRAPWKSFVLWFHFSVWGPCSRQQGLICLCCCWASFILCLFSASPIAKKNPLCKLIWRSAVMKHWSFPARPGPVLLAVLITRVREPGCHRLTGVRRLTGAFQPFVTQMAVPINRKTINHFSKDWNLLSVVSVSLFNKRLGAAVLYSPRVLVRAAAGGAPRTCTEVHTPSARTCPAGALVTAAGQMRECLMCIF